MRPQLNAQLEPPSVPVSSYNEWDPLEEVIVGVIDGASVPAWDITLDATMPEQSRSFFQANVGGRFPAEHVNAARNELEKLVELLTEMDVHVVRPKVVDHCRPFGTPNWQSASGLYTAMPRDVLLIIGDTLIEAPMAWRSRYFEFEGYRPILMDYFKRGAKWISAPKPLLHDELFNRVYDPETPYKTGRYVTGEHEPIFDAADFIRCGEDLFVQRSHVTNEAGIEWVRRHIDKRYRVHVLAVEDPAPMHIDASFIPLAPGKLLLNPERVKTVPEVLQSWEIRFAPEPMLPSEHVLYMSSSWISMNVLSVNERCVIVESQETALVKLLESWGFDVATVSFRNVMRFGGCFHCVTADVRRRGTLQRYF